MITAEEVIEKKLLSSAGKGDAYEKKKNAPCCDGLPFNGFDAFPDDSLCRQYSGRGKCTAAGRGNCAGRATNGNREYLS